MQSSLAVDDGIGAELTGVFGKAPKLSAASHQAYVHGERAGRPHITNRATSGAEQVVQLSLTVGQQGKRQIEVFAVGRQLCRVVSERDHDRKRIAELIEVIAHDDHVFLAWQSSQVTMQDQQQRSAAMILEPPWRTFMIDEGDFGEEFALVDHVRGGHARARRASSMPR